MVLSDFEAFIFVFYRFVIFAGMAAMVVNVLLVAIFEIVKAIRETQRN